ncbi:MAG: dihydropteroate synthase [Planctomycetota bacterium]|nr:dihydropteroate synthase [Planctomycetota bacterium]
MSGSAQGQEWRLSPERSIALDRPRLMGILNITPDSFSDGGRHDTIEAAVGRAMEMESQGADMIDVGGESTRPGSERVEAGTQMERVVPVILAIRERSEIPISIDTTVSEVAQAAIEAGADAINDVSAGLEDEAMFPLAARLSCGLVLMHRLVPPDQDSYSTSYETPPEYDNVVEQVRDFLHARAQVAQAAGVHPMSIVLDPGLGFGKTVDQNWQLIRESAGIGGGGFPLLGAASRKSFLAAICGGSDVPPARRGPASVAASQMQYLGGIRLFRVHDVDLHVQGLALVHGVQEPN